jgi:ABC-type Fe3+-siderophore transport system permease subunit
MQVLWDHVSHCSTQASSTASVPTFPPPPLYLWLLLLLVSRCLASISLNRRVAKVLGLVSAYE